MYLADIELCKELYKLSGWKPEYWKRNSVGVHEYLYAKIKVKNSYPAYDLGYLIRKLPDGTRLVRIESNNYVANNVQGVTSVNSDGATPEEALTKHAVYLFKQNILTKEGV